ncbi:ATP-binding protein [Streptomyces sp. DT24]|uniref:ATP-binding protein n=1 Tax=Streptomyces sp. DT24 TaxID=3416520 RepID=UPI003CF14E9E
MPNDEQTFQFPSAEESVRETRKRVRGTVRNWGFSDEFSDTAELLASELATNAVIHAVGGASYRVICALSDAALTVTVVDHGGGVPVVRHGSGTATHGRGLFLVETLADDWGVRTVPPRGKATYFVLSVPRGTAGGRHDLREPHGGHAGHHTGVTRAARSGGVRQSCPDLRRAG